MTQRPKGFTLIELLVVIAIIGILAAMLFPVFARARESARKIQCLSNVKNIAMAMQMYLTDYDGFAPLEHRAEVLQWLTDKTGCDCDGLACRAASANPYLRWPVILDEYIKNRDVWKCPSARKVDSFGIQWGYGGTDWFKYLQDTWDMCHTQPCARVFPAGWGGAITDSAVQGSCTNGAADAFSRSIGVPKALADLKSSAIDDPVKWLVCADAGDYLDYLQRTSWVAYPDVCRIDYISCYENCGQDWENCPDTQECAGGKGVYQINTDVEYRKKWAKARHLGGENLGFADGHASWMSAEEILFDGINKSSYGHGPNKIANLDCCFVTERF